MALGRDAENHVCNPGVKQLRLKFASFYEGSSKRRDGATSCLFQGHTSHALQPTAEQGAAPGTGRCGTGLCGHITPANKAPSAALGRSWGTGCSPGLPSSLPAPLTDTPCRAAVLNTRFPISAPGFQEPPTLFKARGGEEAAPVQAVPFSACRDPARASLCIPAARRGSCCPPTPPATRVLQSHPTDGAGFRGLGKHHGKQVRAFPGHRAEVPRLPDPQLCPVVSPATGSIS